MLSFEQMQLVVGSKNRPLVQEYPMDMIHLNADLTLLSCTHATALAFLI